MGRRVRVDFHCHSNLSDGYYSPKDLAKKLAAEKIHYAALTDYENLDGLVSFEETATRLGIGVITGLELFAWHNMQEIRILAYGFDRNNDKLKAGFRKPKSAEEVIKVIHDAGGKAFLSHPFYFAKSIDEIKSAVKELKAFGLDGIEVYYQAYPEEIQKELEKLAEEYDLLITGGSDLHGAFPKDTDRLGVELPYSHWKQFRDAIAGLPSFQDSAPKRTVKAEASIQKNWPGFFMRIILPALLSIGLFIGFLFSLVIPSMSESLLARKKEMIKELTNSALSILTYFDNSYQSGMMSLDEAQNEAIQVIKNLRYGDQGKDYFWITDMHPNMIMHPYRVDLDGQDLSDFKDPDGARLFVEFVEVVKRDDEGYVDYVWQWKDDPNRLTAKESFVKGYKPWGWVIGTGIYIEDVTHEIASITGEMASISLLISLIIIILLWVVTHQSLQIERKRGEIERDLRISHDKYRSLLDSTAQGTLVIEDLRCTYANSALLNMLDYTEKEILFLDLLDLLPSDNKSVDPVLSNLDKVLKNESEQARIKTKMVKKDKSMIDTILLIRCLFIADQRGLIISVHEIVQ